MKMRERLCAWMFEITKKPYAKLFKKNKKAWNLSSRKLLTFPEGSLGKKVGEFLTKNKFELIDKLESHDVYHVITGMSTSVKDEVGMQFLLLGNGKKSLYMFTTIGICIFLLPEYFQHFIRCYKKGKRYSGIHKIDLHPALVEPLSLVRWRLSNDRTSKLKIFNHLQDFL
jgi:hypothetical protein